jgi:glutathione peroxidase
VKIKKIALLTIVNLFFLIMNLNAQTVNSAYDFEFNNIDGKTLKLSKYKNKVIVIINVASKCGFTNQYSDMQSIWNKYNKKDFVLIGVPSNDFGKQEPGTNQEIKKFCETNFNITFPMTEKTVVVGDNAHPFYKWAKETYGKKSIPKWNFHKIIINKSGQIIKTFTSFTNPSSKKFIDELNNIL